MKRNLALALSVAIVAALVPAVVAATKPQLSIEAAPKAVTFGDELTISGRMTDAKGVSGKQVTLQHDEHPYGSFERLARATTDAEGNYKFTFRPVVNAKYRTVAQRGAQSAEVTVRVRVAVTRRVSDRTPKKGSRVRFRGTVAPPHDGTRVRIQRRTSGGWKTISRARLRDAGTIVSTFSKRVRIKRSGRYRVRSVPGDGNHAAGNSRRVKITVH